MMRFRLAVALFTGICLLQSPECPAQLKEKALLKGHASYVFRVTFSPDGQLLATGSRDSIIELWEMSSLK